MAFLNYPAVIVAKFETVRGASNYLTLREISQVF